MKTFEITMTTSFKTTIEVQAEDIDEVRDNLEGAHYDTDLAEAEMDFKSIDSRESDFDVMELPTTPEDFKNLKSGEEKSICNFFTITKSVYDD